MKLIRATILLPLLALLVSGVSTASAEGDDDPPVISSVIVFNVTADSATIVWVTDEPGTSVVSYGTDSSLGITTTSPVLVQVHPVVIGGLSADTEYLFQVGSVDDSGNSATDDKGGTFYSFHTAPDVEAPLIMDVAVTTTTTYAATIGWTTDEDSDSVVRYGTSASLGVTTTDPTPVQGHSVTLTGLSPDTLYLFQVESTDASGNSTIDDNDGAFYAFDTSNDVTAPTISNVQVTGVTETSATISWTTDEDADTIVRYGLGAGFGYSSSASTLTKVHFATATGLVPGTRYVFEVQSSDVNGNAATDDDGGSLYSFTTLEATGKTHRSFVGVVVGETDAGSASFTIILQNTGEQVAVRLPDPADDEDFELKTPGGARAGTFEAGARVVVRAIRADGVWVAREIIVKPVKHSVPIRGVVIDVTDGTARVITPQDTILVFQLEEGVEAPLEGDLITAFVDESSKAKGLVRADTVLKRLQRFLEAIANDESDLENDTISDLVDSLVEALESHGAGYSAVIESVLRPAPRNASLALVAAEAGARAEAGKKDAGKAAKRARERVARGHALGFGP